MELTRKQVIDNLEKFVELRLLTSGFCETELFESLIYAISSLKTDEAYQIMYEGGEIFTKADMVAILDKIRTEIFELPTISNNANDVYKADVLQILDKVQGMK